jgi:dihydroxyacetone kinase-like predicted kinase
VIKPPAGDIASAADAVGAADVLVLANHKDVVMAARQASALTRCTLHVIETTSLPQGIAAGLAFEPSLSLAANLERMREAAAGPMTIEVTDAVSDRTVEGVAVRAGQAIALVDGKLRLARDSAVEALVDGVRLTGAPAGSLITLYCGEAADEELRGQAMRELALAFPTAEVERHDGEQPLYTFVASIER